jgi:hypothetical protein
LDETNTLILRDAPSDITESEIQSLLDGVDDCPTILQITPDIANCWYVYIHAKVELLLL